MRSRRFASLLLGMWLAGSLVVTWLVNENSYAVDRLILQADPGVNARLRLLGPVETGMLLRYETAELTRRELRLWGFAQLGFGAFFVLYMLFGTREGKFALALSTLLALCALGQSLYLYPEIASLGRLSDFLSESAGAGYRARLLVMESAYFGVEIAKWVIMAVLAGSLIGSGRARSRSEGVWDQFHVVDKADHGHIDR